MYISKPRQNPGRSTGKIFRSLFCVSTLIWTAVQTQAEGPDFIKEIQPILAGKCFQCHGPDEKSREARLRLDTESGIFSSRKKGKVVDPGSAQESLIFQRITSSDPDDIMPPPETKKPLTSEEVELISAWINSGAEWSGHWAFKTPAAPELPTVTQINWPRTPIDFFILKSLEEKHLKPSPQADRATLIRRATYDLTGLPPTPEEVDNFLNDEDPRAWEKVVNRLLASEKFGERMTLYWMDAARYGDSSVFHADGVRDMWPWRDWVIRAFNNNMPFDQFTIEQLAGDLIPDATIAQKVASGFNRNHGTTDEGGAIAEEYRVEYVVDRVKTTGDVFLGLSMECGQCHDHKYDPISQKEYYKFFAYFNRTKDGGMQTRNGNEPPFVYVMNTDQEAELKSLRASRAELEQRRSNEKPSEATILSWAKSERDSATPAPSMKPWKSVGPFQAASAPEAFSKEIGPEKLSSPDWAATYEDQSWQDQPDWKDGEAVVLSLPGNSSLYLARIIHSSIAQSVSFSLGSDDGIQVWLNGTRIHANNASRGVAPNQDTATGELSAGENFLVVKINNGGGGSGFYFQMNEDSLPEEIRTLVAQPECDLKPEDISRLTDYYASNLWEEGLEMDRMIQQTREKEQSLLNSVPTSMTMEDMEDPRPTYVLNRGHYASPDTSEEIFPGIPEAIFPMPDAYPQNRLGLARWLTHPNHPLTGRVAVNRLWQLLFGTGIVATSSDFGTRGAPPSHPELLDWLARDFVDNGWNLKRAIQQILLSATYQQSSNYRVDLAEIDPDNRLLGRAPRLRLQGEFIRDTALAVSGLLVEEVGGPSVKPYQPPRIWNEVSLDGNLRYQRDSGENLYRRSMYIYWKRSAPMPSMMAFDAPTREKCVVQRPRTNTPLQALVTMNDEQFVEAARKLAERLLSREEITDHERIDFAFRLVTGKPADSVRMDAIQELVESMESEFLQDPEGATEFLKVGESEWNPSLTAPRLAAWTLAASAILNLDETLTRE